MFFRETALYGKTGPFLHDKLFLFGICFCGSIKSSLVVAGLVLVFFLFFFKVFLLIFVFYLSLISRIKNVQYQYIYVCRVLCRHDISKREQKIKQTRQTDRRDNIQSHLMIIKRGNLICHHLSRLHQCIRPMMNDVGKVK